MAKLTKMMVKQGFIAVLTVTCFLMMGCKDHNSPTNAASKIFTVTFNSDGGTPVPKQDVVSGEFATVPLPAPKRVVEETVYYFTGWFLDDKAFAFKTTPITKDITLKASWSLDPPIYTVTFDSSGGSAITGQKVPTGGFATEPASPPTKGNDNFWGWFLDGEDSSFAFTTTPITGDITLTAR